MFIAIFNMIAIPVIFSISKNDYCSGVEYDIYLMSAGFCIMFFVNLFAVIYELISIDEKKIGE